MSAKSKSELRSLRGCLAARLCLVIVLMLNVVVARAAVWTYTNKNSTVWTTASNWQTNGAWGAPPVGITNFPGRINVNATLVYDFATNTGFGTIVNAAPEYGRAMLIASGNVTGQVDVVSGTIVAFQAALSDAVVVGAAANVSGTARATLNMNGGNLLVIATNYGVVSCPFRGSAQTVGTVTINNGSTITVDRFRFGGQPGGGAGSGDIAAGCSGNLYLNSGGTLTTRNVGSLLNPANLRATNYFNGGTLKVKGAEENKNPLIGSNIVNNIMAGGLTIDTAGQNAQTVSPFLNGTGGADGGVVKNGTGTLNLRGWGSTYTGPTIVNAGTLGVQVPMTSTDIRLAGGTTLNFISDNTAPWTVPFLGLTNVNIGFDYGNFGGYNGAVAALTTVRLEGTIKVNLVGTSFPVTNLTLLTYGTKTGSGSFSLGSLPNGAAAVLEDTGSALILHITAPSLQALTWAGSVNNIWQTNGAANWNLGTATYLEYPSGTGDIVTFDDTSSGTINISSVVRPAAVNVNVTGNLYAFSGSGSIAGPTTLFKDGASTLTVSTPNDYTGLTTVNAGTLYVDNAKALGATNEGTVVTSGATLEIGTLSGAGVTVAGEQVNINGNGVNGALGALRGAATATGSNLWAGQVIIESDNARIGTEDNGNLLVSGTITDRGSNLGLILRPGANGTLTIAGTNNIWGGASQLFGGGTSKVVLGADNALSTVGLLQVGECTLDLAGRNQAAAGLALNGGTAGNAIILNNGATPVTLTLTPTTARSFPGTLQDGSAALGIVKNGTNSQALVGANSYTGPTTVNGGELSVLLPMSSSRLTMADGTTLTVAVADSSWSPTTINLTNVTFNLNYGTPFMAPQAVLQTTTLNASGSNVINITGANLPVGTTTLITYSGKAGGGVFGLGTLPLGMQATIADTGSAIVLTIAVSPQTLAWYGYTTGTWNTNGTFDWNYGAAAYKESGPAGARVGDFVVFDDAGAPGVALANDVRPYTVVVTNAAVPYVFTGPGRITGASTLTKMGPGSLTLSNANTYSGVTAVRGGVLEFVSGSLGGTGLTIVANSGTLRWGAANSEDISSRLRIDGATGTPVILDTGTNDIAFAYPLYQNSAGGPISNAVTKLGAGKLTLAAGVNTLGHVTRINGGTLEVPAGATFNVDGGGTVANGALVSDYSAIRISGGTVNVYDRLGVASAGSSTGMVTLASGVVNVEIGSSEATRGLRLAGGTSATVNNEATFNLNGGTLTVPRVFPGNGTPNVSIFNFNGGTLKPSGNPFPAAFMTNLTHAFVRAGGAILDTAGAEIVVGQTLENDGVAATDGGLVKLGAGKLDLAGINTYTGPTVVSNGTLWVSGAIGTNAVLVWSGATLGSTGIISGPVSIQAGGALEPGASSALGEVLAVNSSLQLAGNTRIQIGKLGALPVSDAVVGVTDVTYGGTLTVTNADGSSLAAGDVFTLFAASGAKSGNFSSVQVHPSSQGLTGVFDPNTGRLTLSTAVTSPVLVYTNTGSELRFSWEGTGKLQAQTNSAAVGISNNWADYPGGTVSPVIVPIDRARGAVCFRLIVH